MSQLYRRSTLLNEGFQRQVLRVICRHEADEAAMENEKHTREDRALSPTKTWLSWRSGSISGFMTTPEVEARKSSAPGSTAMASLQLEIERGSLTGSVAAEPRQQDASKSPIYCETAQSADQEEAPSGGRSDLPLAQFAFASSMRLQKVESTSTDGTWPSAANSSVSCKCLFTDGVRTVEVQQAPIKT